MSKDNNDILWYDNDVTYYAVSSVYDHCVHTCFIVFVQLKKDTCFLNVAAFLEYIIILLLTILRYYGVSIRDWYKIVIPYSTNF